MWGGMDKYYNQNELGLSRLNNVQRFNATLNYQILKENRFLEHIIATYLLMKDIDLVNLLELEVGLDLEII